MREITTEQLSCMEVINLCDGGKLGFASALSICPEDGRVTAILIPARAKLLSWGKEPRDRIPWCRVQCVGEDMVLIKMTAAELADCLEKK